MKRIKWTEDLLESEIRKISSDFGRFPTSAYLRGIGRNDIACRMGRTGGANYWAKKLNIEKEITDSDVGWDGEECVIKLLENKYSVIKRHGPKSPYDLLINEVVRVDVKSSHYHEYTMPSGGKCCGWFYRIAKYVQSDLMIFWQSDAKEFYAIPWKLCPSTNITISKDGGKYKNFKNNYKIINDMIKIRAQEDIEFRNLI